MNFAFPRSSTVGGLKITIIFAIPFALIATAIFYHSLSLLFSVNAMQSWPTVPATLQEVSLTPSGKSFRASAVYRYTFEDKSYTGKRVSLYGADNIGSFQNDTFNTLQDYYTRKTPFPAHVDPEDPSSSILMPVFRWEIFSFLMVFIVVFGGAGWGLLISALLGIKTIRAEEKLAAQYPNEPWRHRVQWTPPRIHSSSNLSAFTAVFMAIFWNICCSPMLYAIPGKIKEGTFQVLLLSLFPVLGLGLLYWAFISVMRARRFGRTFLELDTFPGRQGETLRGRMYAPAALSAASEVMLVITCEHNYRVVGSKGRSTIRSEVVWKQEAKSKVATGQSASGDVLVKIEFTIPESLPSSSKNLDSWHAWMIRSEAAIPGANFEAEFEIPVFKR